MKLSWYVSGFETITYMLEVNNKFLRKLSSLARSSGNQNYFPSICLAIAVSMLRQLADAFKKHPHMMFGAKQNSSVCFLNKN